MNRLQLILIAGVALASSGCIILPPTHYVRQTTPYFDDGPPIYSEGEQNTKGPTDWLPGGSKVWETGESRKGYKNVWITFYHTAWIGSHDLTPAEEYEKQNSKK